ncbi:hypothetical protein PhCBS80983_g04528 [Powellomyces hirtus]|uniref:Uncharacterized protein n=1 Tax=Powellomyces hirtus TaxID=109895 RepID=A0A507DYL1_9FUNG|nr:hypothetical protein PhCBS80983_g04528 [Powellomyces hirtus]
MQRSDAVVDAKSVVLFHKHPSLFTRADYDTWILDNLMRPLTLDELDHGETQIVDVCIGTDVPAWTKGETDEDSAPAPGFSGVPLSQLQQDNDHQRQGQNQPEQQLPSRLRFRITPETHIHSFAARYRVAFVVDKSPSMSIVDDSNGKAKALGSIAFETLCQCLDGLCRPFSIPTSLLGGPHYVHPIVYITVIAECGSAYFRGSQSPLAAKHARAHPTRVLLQEVVVTSSNLEAVCERLYDALNAYEHDFVQQRQKDARAAAEAAEESDVKLDIPSESEEASPVDVAAEMSEIAEKLETALPDVSLHSHTIYQAISSALVAVDLMPEDCLPAIVLLTDGVVGALGAGEAVAREAVRELSSHNAVFTIIQVGSSQGFNAGVNLGHVADNEFLRFLAIAAAGTFLYGADCGYLDPEPTNSDKSTSARLPNFYHRHLLMHHYMLAKLATENRYRTVNGTRHERPVDCPRGRLLNATVDTTQSITPEELSFPWEPSSKPPLVAEILCGYRDYPVNVDLKHIILTRLQEGFVLRSVHVTQRAHRPNSKVEIILMMPWFPNVTILYTIKTTWAPTASASHRSILAGRSHKPPRIELNILAQHAFAILFINVQNLDEKSLFTHSVQGKLLKLHHFLKRVYEIDDAFKVIVSFETKYALSAIPYDQRTYHHMVESSTGALNSRYLPAPATVNTNNTSSTAGGGLTTSSTQSNYWQVLTQIMDSHADSFLHLSKDVILRSTSGGGENVWTTRHQVAAMYLHDYLALEWRSFSVGKGIYVKLVHDHPMEQQRQQEQQGEELEDETDVPTGFCVLRILWANECLATLQTTFFNVRVSLRQEILQELTKSIANIEHAVRSSGVAFSPLIVCKKPIARMLARYALLEREDDGDREEQSGPEMQMPSPEARLTRMLDTFETNLIPQSASKNFLRNNRFVWLTDLSADDNVHPANTTSLRGAERMPLDELAFNLLYYKRLEEGFVPISEAPRCLTLYREAKISRRGRGSDKDYESSTITTCAIQFVLINDERTRTVITELFVEPIVDGPAGAEVVINDSQTEVMPITTLFKQHYLVVKERMLEQDRRLVGKLYTFDKIHAIGQHRRGRSNSDGDTKTSLSDAFSSSRKPPLLKKMGPNRSSTVIGTQFKLGHVLQDGRFITCAFRFPVIIEPSPQQTATDDHAHLLPASADAFFPPMPEVTMAHSVPTSPPRTPTMMHLSKAAPRGTSSDRPTTPPRPALAGSNSYNIASGADATPTHNRTTLLHQSSRTGTSAGSSATAGDRSLHLNIPRQRADQIPLALQSPSLWQGLEAIYRAKTARDRVNLALCRYVERMLGSITDGQIPLMDGNSHNAGSTLSVNAAVFDSGLRDACGVEFLERVKEAVEKTFGDFDGGSQPERAGVLCTSLTDSKCYVKVKDAESFLLVFAPMYPSRAESAVTTRRDSTTAAGSATSPPPVPADQEMEDVDRPAYGYMALTLVECVRPRLPPAGIPITDAPPFQPIVSEPPRVDSIRVHRLSSTSNVSPTFSDPAETPATPSGKIAFTDCQTLVEGPAYALSFPDDERRKSESHSNPPPPPLSEYAQDFRAQIKDGVAAAFTKSVYAALLQGYDVDPADLDKAIGACVETSIDVDLTNYLNVRLLTGCNNDGESDQDTTQAKFRELLAEFLDPVPCFSCRNENVFFYRPKPNNPIELGNGAPLTAPLVSQRSSNLNLPSQATPTVRRAPTPLQSMMHLDIPSHFQATASNEFDTLSKVLECAGTPLFVRTECSFMKRNMSDADHLQIPAAKLPTSYKLPQKRKDGNGDNDSLDFTPSSVGTDVSPVQSADGTRAVLHLLCLTVPALNTNTTTPTPRLSSTSPWSSDPRDKTLPEGSSVTSPPTSERANSGDLDEPKTPTVEARSHLDKEKQKALQETTRKIESLLEDEVMYLLLPVRPIQESTLLLIEGILRRRHLENAGRGVESLNLVPTITDSEPSLAVNVPLSFVRAASEIDLFRKEFEGLETGFGKVIRMGDMFYIPNEGLAAREELVSPSVDARRMAAEQMQGLGISLDGDGSCDVLNVSDKEASAPSPSSPSSSRPVECARFWLVAVIVDMSVQVYFYSKEVGGYKRLAIVGKLREGITNCCERVNRSYLLRQLAETHVASRYLIPPTIPINDNDSLCSTLSRSRDTDEDDITSNPSPPPEMEGWEAGHFQPGRFACPHVFRRTFPLHWRLKSLQALSAVALSLQAFAIVNRRNMFVFAAPRSVFYIILRVEEIDATEKGTGKESAGADRGEPLSADVGAESYSPSLRTGVDSPRGPASPVMRRSTVSSVAAHSHSAISNRNNLVLSTAATTRSPDYELILDVFGIDPPGKELTKEFLGMVELKINGLTQHVLASYLARNLTMKLTQADLDFILPAGRGVESAGVRWFKLPQYVHSPYVFLLLYRQMLIPWLHILGGADVIGGLTSHYGMKYGWADRISDSESSLSRAYEVQFSDFVFMYNCLPTRHPTPVETAVGQGIACVCVALLDEGSRVMIEAPGVFAEGEKGNIISDEELLNSFQENKSPRLTSPDEWHGYKIAVEIWCHGSINTDGLFTLVERAFQNTVLDYAVEATVGTLIVRNAADRSWHKFGGGDSVMYGASCPATPDEAIEHPSQLPDMETAPSPFESAQNSGENLDTFSVFYTTIHTALETALDADDPMVKRMVSPISLPPLVIEEFVGELQELFAGTQGVSDIACLKKTSPSTTGASGEQKNATEHLEFEPYKPMKRDTGGPYARSLSSSVSSLMEVNPDEKNGELFVTLAGLKNLNPRYGLLRLHNLSSAERKSSFEIEGTGHGTSTLASSVALAAAAALSIQPVVRTPITNEDSDSEASTSGWLTGQPWRRLSRAGRSLVSVAGLAQTKAPEDPEAIFTNNLHPSALELGPRSKFLFTTIENSKVVVYAYNWEPTQCDNLFRQILRILSWNHLRLQFLEKELALLQQQKGASLRHLSLRVPREVPEADLDVVPQSYGGDTKAMVMATQFQQQIAATAVPPLWHQSATRDAATNPVPEVAVASKSGNDIDILQRHAVEFLDWLVRHIKITSAAQDAKQFTARSISTPLMSPFMSAADASKRTPPAPPSVNASDMAKILRSVRLLHFVKYPIMFTDLRHQLLANDGPAANAMDFRPEDVVLKESAGVTSSPAGTPMSVTTPGGMSPWSLATTTTSNVPQLEDETTILWYNQMLEGCVKDYVAYLQHLGMDYVYKEGELAESARFNPSQSLNPSYWVSARLSIKTEVTYLVQWFAKGVVIAQIGIDGIFACVNLYTLDLPDFVPPRLGPAQQLEVKVTEGGAQDDGFVEACKRLKNYVHLNSYVYDFHLRYIQNVLERRVRTPTPVDVLLVLKAFALFNPRKANFARSRIHRGSCAIEDGQVSSSLFQYILKNPLRYGFFPILFQGQPIACSLTSTTPDFRRPGSGSSLINSEDQPENVYTIVVYSTTEEQSPRGSTSMGMDSATSAGPPSARAATGDDHQQQQQQQQQTRAHQRKSSAGSSSATKLCLRYFLLVVSAKTPFPHEEVDNNRSSTMGTAMLYDPLHEYLAGGYYLKDIVRHAERKVERLIEQAIRYYGRDNLWRQLLRAQDPASIAAAEPSAPLEGPQTDDGIYEWAKLFLEKIEPNSRPLSTLDPSLGPLFANPAIPWLKLLDHLRSFYSYSARELVESEDGLRRHLVLFNPRNEDYLIHFVAVVRRDLRHQHHRNSSHSHRKSNGSYSQQQQRRTLHLPALPFPLTSPASFLHPAPPATTSAAPTPTASSTPKVPTQLRTGSVSSVTDVRNSSMTTTSNVASTSSPARSSPSSSPLAGPSRPSLDSTAGTGMATTPNTIASHPTTPALEPPVDMDVYAVSREGVVDEVEYHHISDVVNTISAWLWTQTRDSLVLAR